MPDESLQGKGRWVRQIAVSLDELQWERLRQAAEAETGMELSGTRFPRLQEAVTNVLDRQQSATPLEVILADSRQRSTFLERLCAELTIGESFFLRNEHHFRALREQVLPGIIKQNESSRTIRIWSAGCATGEEPYSLAILLDELLPDPDQWNVHILATDLNPEFLETAREARYRKWSFRGTNICNNRNYFKPEGALFRLDPRLRRRVRFSYLNLVKDVYPSPMTRSKRFTR
jgi:chemotaxis protein methyltransferase CheR